MNWYKVECNITVMSVVPREYLKPEAHGMHQCYDDGDDVCMTPGPTERERERSGLFILRGVEA